MRLGVDWVDLDTVYMDRALARASTIAGDIEREGYGAYVRRNVELYGELARVTAPGSVMVTSSGFMIYDPQLHPAIGSIQRRIVADPGTLLLMPAFDEAACVTEIVARQQGRAHLAGVDRREHLRTIRSRFRRYADLDVKRVATSVNPEAVAAACERALRP